MKSPAVVGRIELGVKRLRPQRETAARFVLRRSSEAQQLLGCQFEFVRAAEPDKPLSAASFRALRGGFEVEMLEPIAELKLLRESAEVGTLVRLFYKLPRSDVIFLKET